MFYRTYTHTSAHAHIHIYVLTYILYIFFQDDWNSLWLVKEVSSVKNHCMCKICFDNQLCTELCRVWCYFERRCSGSPHFRSSCLFLSDSVILILDGTYIYIQKSSKNKVQRRCYSMHKHGPLVKPMVIVTTTGYIIYIIGSLFANGKINDVEKHP